MRRPIRSHVANRRMFQGGGLSPFPRPTGILASSQPLVDQVAQNTINPNRTMPMNQGGFANGGAPYFPGQRIQDVTIETAKDLAERGRNVLGRIGLAGQEARSYVPPVLGGEAFTPEHDTLVSSGQVVRGTEGRLVADIGVTDVTTYGDPLGVGKDFNWRVENPQAGTITLKDFDFQSLTGKIIGAKDWFNETPWMTGRRIFPMFDQMKGVGGLDSAIYKMTWHLPQYENEIEQIAAQIIEQTPDITPEDLRNQIAVTLKTNIEGQNPSLIKIQQEGAANLYEDTQGQDTITLAESIEANKRPVDEILTEMSGQPQIGPDINLLEKMEYNRRIDALIPYWEKRDFDSGFIETLREKGVSDEVLSGLVNQRIELIAERDRRGKAVTETGGYGVGPRDGTPTSEGKGYGSFTKGVGQGRGDVPIGPEIEVVDSKIKSNMEYEADEAKRLADEAKIDKTEADADGTSEAKEILIEAANINTPQGEKDTEKFLKDYKKEFIDAMPEYEGMSKDEKAYAWIKMGMAIASGQSPNAITNISKGVLATIDEFSDDPKKRREYKQQLQLSAANYALQRLAQDKKLSDQDERNGEWFVDRDLNPVFVSTQDMIDNNIPKNIRHPNLEIALINAAKTKEIAFNKAVKDLRKEFVISDTYKSEVQKAYKKSIKDFNDAEVGKVYMEKAIVTLAEDGSTITGFVGGFQNLGNKMRAIMGWDPKKEWSSIAQLRTDVRLAFQKLIPVSLGGVQSANSISNRDVQFLADAYVNSHIQSDDKSFSLMGLNEDMLMQQFQSTLNIFKEKQLSALTNIEQIETDLANRILPGQVGGTTAFEKWFANENKGDRKINALEAVSAFRGQLLPELMKQKGTTLTVGSGADQFSFKQTGVNETGIPIWDIVQ